LLSRCDFLLVFKALLERGLGLVLNSASDTKRCPLGKHLATAGTFDLAGVTHLLGLAKYQSCVSDAYSLIQAFFGLPVTSNFYGFHGRTSFTAEQPKHSQSASASPGLRNNRRGLKSGLPASTTSFIFC
jgi:hypothetical protein